MPVLKETRQLKETRHLKNQSIYIPWTGEPAVDGLPALKLFHLRRTLFCWSTSVHEENSTDFTGLGTEAVLTLEVGIFDLEVGLRLSILTSIVLTEKSGQFHNENVQKQGPVRDAYSVSWFFRFTTLRLVHSLVGIGRSCTTCLF